MLHKDKIQRKISPFIQSQLPLYLDLQYDKVADGSISKFGRFMQLYYEWLETSYDATIDDFKFQSIQQVSDMAISDLHAENGNVYDRINRLESFRDVDNTIYKLLQYIKSEYNPDLPSNTYADDRKLIKRIKEIYRARGTESVFSIFFRILYQKEPTLIYPKDFVFTCSDSEWKKPKSIRVIVNGDITTDDHASFKGYYIVGLTSGAKAVVEDVYVRNIGTTIVTDLYLDMETGITGTFGVDEVVVVETNEGYAVNKTGTTTRLQAKIKSSAQGITFTNKGTGYYLDDVITLANVQETTMIIKRLSEGQVDEFYTSGITNGDAGTEVNFVNDYLEVYGVEGTFAQNDTLTGSVSGATAKIRFIDGSRYWVDNISGIFKTDDTEQGEYIAEEITSGSNKLRADRLVSVAVVSASATVVGANSINVNSGGVYRGIPKAYLTEATITTKILKPYSTSAGGIEVVEVITKGLADSTSTVSFRTHDPHLPLIRATGTVTYGALVEHDGSYGVKKSNLNGESYIQDLDYYQWWSYKIRVSEDPDKWRGQLNKFAHPAGMRVFTDFTIDSSSTSSQTTSTTVYVGDDKQPPPP